MRISVRAIVAIGLLATSFGLFAGTEVQPSACEALKGGIDPVYKAVSVSGVVSGDGLDLKVTPGALATKGLRVYSEPSHTLLLVLAKGAFRKSGEGRAWLTRLTSESPQALVFYERDGVAVEARVPVPPSTDTYYSVWMNGAWPSGEERELLVAEAAAPRDRFGFSVGYKKTPEAFRMTQHCCTHSVCGQQCVECSGTRFTCCTGQWACCCSIACGLAPCPGPGDCTFQSCT